MATRGGKKLTAFPGIDVISRDKNRDAVIRFDLVNTAPTTATGHRFLYVDTSGRLTYDDGSATTILGAPGASATTWEGLFTNDTTFAIAAGTWTITQSSANALLTLNHTSVGAGAVIDITNSGTGADIRNGSVWSIIGPTVGILELSSGGTINATGGALTIGATGTATTFAGTVTVNGASTLTGAVTATASLTITGTADTNCLTVTAGDVVLSNGKITLTNDDTDAALTMTANSVTTGSVISVTANGVTSGDMILLTTTDSGFSGNYLRITDGSDVFTIGDEGATVIVGAAVGTAALTLTAGDIVVSGGNFALTSTSTSDVFSITDDSLLANNALIVTGSGAFTGNTTSAFVAITPTGLTTGTAFYIAAAAATTTAHAMDVTMSGTTGTGARFVSTGVLTGVGGILDLVADSATTPGASVGEGLVKLSADGLTTGTALDVTSTSIVLTTGRLADFSHISGNITGTLDKTVDLFSVVSTRTVTTGAVADDFDMVSFVRASTGNGAGTFTATGAVLYVENATTSTTMTVADTTNGIEMVMDSGGTGDALKITHNAVTGKSVNVVANALTTGTSVLVTANALTSGQMLSLASSATVIATTGRIFLSTHSGTTGSTAILNEFVSAANDETTVLQVTASDIFAAGVLLDLSR